MGVTSDGKWMSVEPVDMPIAAVAQQMLALRLADVLTALPLAAREPNDDVEDVHRLRVSCRRAAAALRAFRSLAPRRAKKLSRWLKRLRRAAGPARDADVLLARLRRELDPASEFATQIAEHAQEARASAQRDLAAINAKAAKGGLQRAVDTCLKALASAKGAAAEESFAQFARERLADAAQCLATPDLRTATLAELHQLRIAGKRLRYSIELFHSAASTALRDQAYPIVEEMQDRLGALNDRAAAQQRWQNWLVHLPPDSAAAAVARLVVADHDAAERIRREFLQWWLPDRQAQLQQCLQVGLA